MNILCTNDDGLHARGIAIVSEVCAKLGKIWTVAPDREQSATSHSLTLMKPLRPTLKGERRWEVDGTPTDCVLLAINALLLPERADFVVSGLNHGPNMGEDVLYSGTVAAAMEGLSLGVPAVALSYAGSGSDHETMATWSGPIEYLLQQIFAIKPFPPDTLLNVNVPPIPGSDVKGIRVTKLGSRVYAESLKRMTDPWGRDIFWIGGGHINWTGDADSDFQAIADGYISVTPLHLDLTSYARIEDVRLWKLATS